MYGEVRVVGMVIKIEFNPEIDHPEEEIVSTFYRKIEVLLNN